MSAEKLIEDMVAAMRRVELANVPVRLHVNPTFLQALQKAFPTMEATPDVFLGALPVATNVAVRTWVLEYSDGTLYVPKPPGEPRAPGDP
ncbi:MAG: hypothetical protein ABW123_06185 [Cystobacter sp.]